MPVPPSLLRCHTVTKPGLGAVHLHAFWWRPNRVTEMLFEPEGRPVLHAVPEEHWDNVFAAGTFEQVMALVRAGDTRPSH